MDKLLFPSMRIMGKHLANYRMPNDALKKIMAQSGKVKAFVCVCVCESLLISMGSVSFYNYNPLHTSTEV